MLTNILRRQMLTPRRAVSSSLALMTALVLGMVMVSAGQAQTFTTLYNFTGGADGGYPSGGLVQDTAGSLYGTTADGGSSGYGTVFKLDTAGKETVLHSFKGADGSYPGMGPLVMDSAGTLYGTTFYGGASGYGTVFKLDTAGQETVLHSFTGKDGSYPTAGVIRDSARNLYGTTLAGGTSDYGTVFKLSKAGRLTVLHSFRNTDGAYPIAGVVLDSKGNLYGATEEGGPLGYGTVFKLSKIGKETVLFYFGESNGSLPWGTPFMDASGDLYGTADEGGFLYDRGTVWRFTKTGGLGVLHQFAGGTSDGEYPRAGVVLDSNGNLYGNTEWGGSSGSYGTVYELSGATVTLLHTFSGPDGSFPVGTVLRDANGNLYGATTAGGSYGAGTVWEITP